MKSNSHIVTDPRIRDALNVIFEFALGNLKAHGTISERNDDIDALITGINILGEEMEAYIAELKKSEEKLRESEEMFKGVFDSARDGMLLADVEAKKLLMGNRTICRMLGYDEEEIKNLNVIDIHPEKDLPYVIEQFEKQSRKEIGLVSLPVKRKDGSVFYADVSAAPMILQGKAYSIGIFRDTTERTQAAEEISRLNEDLKVKMKELIETQEELVRKEKLATLGQLSGSVGHELRNPMGVISNAVYFLQTVMPDADETVREYLGIIKSEVNNSQRIITDLLDFTKTKTPQTKVITVDDLIKQSLEKCAVPANVTLRVEISNALPEVKVDPLQMKQVIENLVTNAVQAMLNGGSLTIRAEEDRESDALSISVADTGEGISPENMSKLFQPLFTTKARGIGLGLTVVKNLIAANGGRIEVQSESGKGTTFTVILPCERA